jgi:OmpR family response regulator RpaB
LTVIQFNLLKLLTDNIGKGLKRSTILFHIWGYIPERDVDTRLIDVHISRLRSKIEETPNKPDLIITVRGVGYMLNPSKI